jgi:hypothetical protein
MRDKRFIAEHRGGPLKKDQHYQLMNWACNCAEHVIHLVDDPLDGQLRILLLVGRAWAQEKATVGEARNASVSAHSLARATSDTTAIAVARSVGHAVATAHMADHSLGSAWYVLKAVKNAGESIKAEEKWQNNLLPKEVRGLIISARGNKKFQIK